LTRDKNKISFVPICPITGAAIEGALEGALDDEDPVEETELFLDDTEESGINELESDPEKDELLIYI
jgi:hypothetical protein